MKTLKEKIEVMQAAERGEQIECIGLAGSLVASSYAKWTAVAPGSISWNWGAFDYRVAPKLIEGYLNVYLNSKPVFHGTKETADMFAKPARTKCVKMREVTE